MSKERAASMRALARHYHALGFNVLPLAMDKHPALVPTPSGTHFNYRWETWQTTRQSEAQLADILAPKWWVDVSGIGAICGPVSGGLACIDFDLPKGTRGDFPRKVVDRFLTLAGLPSDYGWTVRTPRGGWHVWVLCPDLAIDKGKLDFPAAAMPSGYHIELRFTGHYAALPDSTNVDGTYTWHAGHAPEGAPATVDPDRLLTAYHGVVDPEKPAEQPAKGKTRRTSGTASAGHGGVTPRAAKAIAEETATLRTAPEGGRNDRLNEAAFSLGTLVGAGDVDRATVEVALLDAARACGLEDGETRRTMASGLDKGIADPREPAKVTGTASAAATVDGADITPADAAAILEGGAWWGRYHPCEADLCDAFLELHGDDWRYVTLAEMWFRWSGTHWKSDETREFRQVLGALQDHAHAETMAEGLSLMEAAGADKDAQREAAEMLKTAAAWKRQHRRMIAADALARDARAIHLDALSAGNLLNLQNGCLDLNSYELRPHRRADMLTHVLPYDYDANADCPRWRRFIDEVLVDEQGRPDAELAALVQEAMGYSLTTETNLEAFFFLSGSGGSGSNGKSTLLRTLAALLGESLSMTLDLAALSQYGSDYRLALVSGKRVVFSTEAKAESRVADDIFRRIASGETLDARPINKAPIQIHPVAKLWWAQNAQPAVADTSDGFWRRLRLVPFRREFAEQDKDIYLAETLRRELPGILNWSLDGLRRLRKQGRFTAAKQATTAAAEYRQNQNAVALWMDERTTLGLDPKARPMVHPLDISPIGWTKARDAYESYRAWCEGNGRPPKNSTKFGYEVRNELRQRKAGDKQQNYLGVHYPFGLVEPAQIAPGKAAPEGAKPAGHGGRGDASDTDLLESLGV